MRDKPEATIVEAAAGAAYAVHRAYRSATSGEILPTWGNAVVEFKNRLRAAARKALEQELRDGEAIHASFLEEKAADGWKLTDAVTKDERTKLHPYLVPWAELPEHERAARSLFAATVQGAAIAVASDLVAEERSMRVRAQKRDREALAAIRRRVEPK